MTSVSLSLPETSRLTGIPMPTILRLARENPEKIPSTGSGSQRYFSSEVIPVLRELYQAELEAERERPERRALFLVPRPKRAPAPREVVPTDVEIESAAPRQTSDENLARRIQALEARMDALGEEIRETIDYLSQPRSAMIRLL